MKKLLLACCLGAAAIAAYAQPQQPGPSPEKRLEYLQKSLQLTDAQAKKVKPILEQSAQQRQSLMEKYKPQFEAFHQDMKNLDSQTHSQLAGVLTPAQMQALDTQRGGRGHFRGKGNRFFDGRNGGPKPPAAAAE